jgi:hypothetical protein
VQSIPNDHHEKRAKQQCGRRAQGYDDPFHPSSSCSERGR